MKAWNTSSKDFLTLASKEASCVSDDGEFDEDHDEDDEGGGGGGRRVVETAVKAWNTSSKDLPTLTAKQRPVCE